MLINNVLSNSIYIYQSCKKLDAMGISSRTGVMSLIYKKGDKEDITNYSHCASKFRLTTTFTLQSPRIACKKL